MKYNFLYTSDSNYFDLMYISIYSLLKNNQYPLTIHIIESDFTTEQISKLENLFSLYNYANFKLYSIDKLKDTMDRFSIPKWRGTDIANARLFSGEIVSADKILYIDSDTIITSSLKEVFDTNRYSAVSAVKELNIPSHLKGKLESYYNTGVLLIDYRLCEELDLLKLISDTLYTTTPLIYPDQDLLNLSLKEQIGTLQPNYNLNPIVYDMVLKYPFLTRKYFEKKQFNFYTMDELVKAYKNPIVYHLLSQAHIRPWVKNYIHSFNKVFDYYSKESMCDFRKDKPGNNIDLIISYIPLFSTLAMLLEILPGIDTIEVKQKIKKYIYSDRK